MKRGIIMFFIIVGVLLVWNSIVYVPAGKVSNVQTAGVTSNTNRRDISKNIRIETVDKHEYVIYWHPEGGGITHHEGCSNPHCIDIR